MCNMYPSEPRKGQKILKEIAKVFKKFGESTTLHGYLYLNIQNSIGLKILWSIVIIAFTCIGVGFVITNTNDYLSSSIITTLDTSHAPLTVSIQKKRQVLIDFRGKGFRKMKSFDDFRM